MILSDPYLDVADDCEVLRETGGALRVRIPVRTMTVERWVPKSVLSPESEIRRWGSRGMLIVKTWWARKEGLHPNEENYVLNLGEK